MQSTQPTRPNTLVVHVLKCMAVSPQAAEVIVWNNSLLFEDFWKPTGRGVMFYLTYFIPSLSQGRSDCVLRVSLSSPGLLGLEGQ